MRHSAVLLAAGGLFFLLFLVATVPARLLAQITPAFGLELINPSGSVWRGQASALRLPGFATQAVSWDLHQSALLAGRLGADVDAKLPNGFLRGELSAGLGGRVRLRELEAAGSLAMLAAAAGLPASGGEFSLTFDYIELRDNWPVAAVGEIRLRDVPLALPGLAGGQSSSFAATFEQAEPGDELTASLSDAGGPLELAGSLLLRPTREYEIAGTAKARAEAGDDLRRGLTILGPETADGRRQFSMAGSL